MSRAFLDAAALLWIAATVAAGFGDPPWLILPVQCLEVAAIVIADAVLPPCADGGLACTVGPGTLMIAVLVPLLPILFLSTVPLCEGDVPEDGTPRLSLRRLLRNASALARLTGEAARFAAKAPLERPRRQEAGWAAVPLKPGRKRRRGSPPAEEPPPPLARRVLMAALGNPSVDWLKLAEMAFYAAPAALSTTVAALAPDPAVAWWGGRAAAFFVPIFCSFGLPAVGIYWPWAVVPAALGGTWLLEHFVLADLPPCPPGSHPPCGVDYRWTAFVTFVYLVLRTIFTAL
jgi:hypothetical protein